MYIKNYTPHDINIYAEKDGKLELVETLKSEGLARVEQKESLFHHIGFKGKNVPVKRFEYGEITGLPEHTSSEEYFIVSALVAQAAIRTKHPLKDHLYIVADTVRNEQNQIIGCKSLAIYS